MKNKMFDGAGNLIFQNAKALRKQPTDAERMLWMHLRTRPGGHKFRRQHPAGNFILDFYCHALKLAIEVDGSVHNDAQVKLDDQERQTILENTGITVIRFTNTEIMQQMESVMNRIEEAIAKCSADQH
jgi:imidazole glycerol-phosphate synthase subunit HisF